MVPWRWPCAEGGAGTPAVCRQQVQARRTHHSRNAPAGREPLVCQPKVLLEVPVDETDDAEQDDENLERPLVPHLALEVLRWWRHASGERMACCARSTQYARVTGRVGASSEDSAPWQSA